MCGIAGQARDGGGAVAEATIERMCRMQEHRGPDSRGSHIEPGIGLGIQRLRVIDLETGDQPVYNEDQSVAVVLNGEIYNYRELRAGLLKRGHRLTSKGDSEVIAHLYEEHGVDCVGQLKGMFAFALWDAGRRRLLLARDRIGKKPLYYSRRPGALSFASELPALLQDPEIPREVDHRALDAYLANQYVPAPLSAFRGVEKLPHGCRLIYEGGEPTVERYWRLRYDLEAPTASGEELHSEIRDRIRAAVRARMISDVPLGVFLSGGIDSSTVVAAMAEASPDPVRTFSIGFEEESFNELPNARLVAERFGTDHRELIIKPDVVSILPKVVRHYGEPFGDSSSVPSFYVSEMARRDVTVALNGDGGDECFAGYNRYVSVARAHRLGRLLPAPLRRAIGGASVRSAERGDPMRPLNRARRLGRLLGGTDRERFAANMSLFTLTERHRLYSPEFGRAVGDEPVDVIGDGWSAAGATDLVNTMLEVDVNTYLPGDLLPKIDIASMAHSLEARSPFLDHELMQFAASLPGPVKLRGLEKKAILKDALRGWIPDQVLDAPKRGFALPMVGQWFRGDLRGFITEVLTDPKTTARGYFRRDQVDEMLAEHLDGRRERGNQLWGLLMLELWHRELIDAPAGALEPVSAHESPL